MLLTADHDDRVVPLHSMKLLAVSFYQLKLEHSAVFPLIDFCLPYAGWDFMCTCCIDFLL